MSDPLRILREQKISLAQVCERLGTDDKPIHFTTAFRAVSRGVLAPSGERVVLESLKLGGRIVSSIEAVERFICATNGISLDDVEAGSTSVSSKRRAKELAQVDAQLAAAGI